MLAIAHLFVVRKLFDSCMIGCVHVVFVVNKCCQKLCNRCVSIHNLFVIHIDVSVQPDIFLIQYSQRPTSFILPRRNYK